MGFAARLLLLLWQSCWDSLWLVSSFLFLFLMWGARARGEKKERKKEREKENSDVFL
jgi:hypothetical protein